MGDLREEKKLRVAKTPERISYAIEQFKRNNVEYTLKNESAGHFHCHRKSDDKLVQFWAGKGTIMIDNKVQTARGIHALIKILCEEVIA